MRPGIVVLSGCALSIGAILPSRGAGQQPVPPVSAQIDAAERASAIESLLRIRGGGIDNSAPVDSCSLAAVLTDSQGHAGTLPDLRWLISKPADGASCGAGRRPDYRNLSRRIYLTAIERDTTASNHGGIVVTARYINDEYSHEERYVLRPSGKRSGVQLWGLVEIRQSRFTQAELAR